MELSLSPCRKAPGELQNAGLTPSAWLVITASVMDSKASSRGDWGNTYVQAIVCLACRSHGQKRASKLHKQLECFGFCWAQCMVGLCQHQNSISCQYFVQSLDQAHVVLGSKPANGVLELLRSMKNACVCKRRLANLRQSRRNPFWGCSASALLALNNTRLWSISRKCLLECSVSSNLPLSFIREVRPRLGPPGAAAADSPRRYSYYHTIVLCT